MTQQIIDSYKALADHLAGGTGAKQRAGRDGAQRHASNWIWRQEKSC